MGTIIINQTDCKQNVVLQSSVDGITGGYYDAAGVWHEIGAGSEITEIKVNIGKGRSGTSIVDDTKRAITDKIPFDKNKEEISCQLYAPYGYYGVLVLCTGDDSVESGATGIMPASYLGQTSPSIEVWINQSYDGVMVKKAGSGPYTLPDFSVTNGNVRIMFKKGEAGTDTVEDVFDGYIVVDDIVYHLTSN